MFLFIVRILSPSDCSLIGYKEPEDKLEGVPDKKGGHSKARFVESDEEEEPDSGSGGRQVVGSDDSDGY